MKRIRANEAVETTKVHRMTADGRPAFTKGAPKVGGRQKGTPNKVPTALKTCIMNAMDKVGSDNRGTDKATGYLAYLAWRKPELFARLLEKLLPYSLVGSDGGPVQVSYTSKDEITLRFKERGLPLPPNLIAPPKGAKPLPELEVIDDAT